MQCFATFRTHIGNPIPYDPSVTSEQLAVKVFLINFFHLIDLFILIINSCCYSQLITT